MNLKIAFAGTPDFAAQHLKALLKAGFEIVAVFTQPDRPRGRGKKLQASPVKTVALEQNLPVYQPKNLKNFEIQTEIKKLDLDYLVVVAYGLILPDEVLKAPKFGCINVHASLLPRWRGAAPIQRSILAGDEKTGISLMQMDSGLDTGDVFLKSECKININETSSSLTQKLVDLGINLLTENLANLQNLKAQAQEDKNANYAQKLEKSESQLDFSSTAKILDRKIRAFEPAWFLKNKSEQNNSSQKSSPERIRVWQAKPIEVNNEKATGAYGDLATKNYENGEIINISPDGILIGCGNSSFLLLEKIQLEGGKALFVKDLLNGKKLNWQIGKLIYE